MTPCPGCRGFWVWLTDRHDCQGGTYSATSWVSCDCFRCEVKLPDDWQPPDLSFHKPKEAAVTSDSDTRRYPTDREILIRDARRAIEGRRAFEEEVRPAVTPLTMKVDPHFLLKALGAEEE